MLLSSFTLLRFRFLQLGKTIQASDLDLCLTVLYLSNECKPLYFFSFAGLWTSASYFICGLNLFLNAQLALIKDTYLDKATSSPVFVKILHWTHTGSRDISGSQQHFMSSVPCCGVCVCLPTSGLVYLPCVFFCIMFVALSFLFHIFLFLLKSPGQKPTNQTNMNRKLRASPMSLETVFYFYFYIFLLFICVRVHAAICHPLLRDINSF